MFKVSAKELLLWIHDILEKDSDHESLYFLLDLAGGISKKDLNSFRLNDKQEIFLNEDLNSLYSKWQEFIIKKKPIQYICGNTYWRNHLIRLNEKVLIPRVETEQIIDIFLNIFKSTSKHILFADLGTGSGIIGISLSLHNSNWYGLATDIDSEVIKIARRNFCEISKANNLEFFCGNWLKPLFDFSGKIDAIIANPPYIPTSVYERLPTSVKKYEPKLALNGGKDGLFHLNEIIYESPKYLKKGGWIILEHHFDQGLKVKDLLISNGFVCVDNIYDLFGVRRFTIGKYN